MKESEPRTFSTSSSISKDVIKKIRDERKKQYNAMPLEEKIDYEEFVLRLRLEDGHKYAYISLMKIIKLLGEKIKLDHCE